MSKLIPCRCPATTELLPADVHAAAQEGGADEVRKWFSSGGDVNAITYEESAGGGGGGVTLLAAACESGQSKVVKCLLQHPVLHLNTTLSLQYGRRCSPLWLAAYLGHEECVRLLLSALTKSQCRLNVGLAAETKDGQLRSPVMAAAEGGHWGIFRLLLAVHETLRSDEASFLLRAASAEDRWNEVRMVLERNLPLPMATYTHLLLRAREQGEMEVVRQVLKGNFRYKDDCVCELLPAAVERRNWDDVKELLAFMDKEIMLDEDLAKAALEDDLKNFKNIIKNRSDNAVDGVRLVVAAGGTSEQVSTTLYTEDSDNQHVIDCSLLLSAMMGHLEVLLSVYNCYKNSLTYAVTSRARGLAAREGHMDAEKFLAIALTKRAERMLSFEEEE